MCVEGMLGKQIISLIFVVGKNSRILAELDIILITPSVIVFHLLGQLLAKLVRGYNSVWVTDTIFFSILLLFPCLPSLNPVNKNRTLPPQLHLLFLSSVFTNLKFYLQNFSPPYTYEWIIQLLIAYLPWPAYASSLATIPLTPFPYYEQC